MNKIFLIMGREIKAKLFNRTFLVMTVLAPVLIAAFFAIVIKMTQSENTEQNVLVLDESGLFKEKLMGNENIALTYTNMDYNTAQQEFYKRGYSSLLWIAPNIVEGGAGATKLIYKKSPGFAFKTYVQDQMERILYDYKLRSNHIDPDIIHNSKQKVQIISRKVDENGKPIDTSDMGLLGFGTGAIMFVFVMVYGMMVFRSVMEEKTNRIVEVIISSVKPIQLMLGKILGVAILGVIQFIIMSVITSVLISVVSLFLLKDVKKELKAFEVQQEMVRKQGTNYDLNKLEHFEERKEIFDMLQKFQKVNFGEVIACFILYFIGGFLFYSSIMAAIGSAVDTEADSQQFITPVILPLILGYVIAVKVITDPDSTTVFWASLIPFTSPIVMMSRISNGGVPIWQVLVSIFALYGTFIVTTLLAARIYRTGILMYGKKTSWREIGRWLFYR